MRAVTFARVAALLAALFLTATAAMAATGQRVSLPSIDLDLLSGEPVMLGGLFFTPDPSAGGFPAVIALHGCDGMYSTARRRAAAAGSANGIRRWRSCSPPKACVALGKATAA